MSFLRTCVAGVVMAPLLLLAGDADAQTAEPLPIPSPILSARRVFLSNAGLDGVSLQTFRRHGDVNTPFNRFYAAMKAWGRFELVNAPADADLVMEMRFTAPMVSADPAANLPGLYVTLVDAKTHFILWTIGEQVDGASRPSIFLKNLDECVSHLIADLKELVAHRAPTANQR